MEAIHTKKLEPPLNRNVGKVNILQVFNNILSFTCTSTPPLHSTSSIKASLPARTASYYFRFGNLEY